MKLARLVFGGLALASLLVCAGASAQEAPRWSAWLSMRGHFQFQFRTERAGDGIMRVHMRVRPDAARIRAEPHYSGERYYLEYYQYMDPAQIGHGTLTMNQPRRIVFEPTSFDTCVYEEPDGIFARNEPEGTRNRVYMRDDIPLPIADEGGQMVSGVNYVVGFGTNTGPGAVVRFSGVNMSDFTPAC